MARALDAVTRTFLEFSPREKTLVVFGVSASKEVAGIADVVASRFDHFILTRAYKSGADVGLFAGTFAKRARDVIIAPDTAEAARLAKTRAEREGLSVLALGGSWLAPKDLIAKGDWAAITQLAREASDIVKQVRP